MAAFFFSLSDLAFLFTLAFVVNDTEKKYHEPTSQLYSKPKYSSFITAIVSHFLVLNFKLW